jgi:hypothetical protein
MRIDEAKKLLGNDELNDEEVKEIIDSLNYLIEAIAL